MKAKELLVSAGSLLLAGLILVAAGNILAPTAAANAAAEQQEMMETCFPEARSSPRKRTRGPMPILRPSGKGKAAGS